MFGLKTLAQLLKSRGDAQKAKRKRPAPSSAKGLFQTGGFFTQHTNPRRNAERRLTKQMGHRQHRLLTKRLRRAEKEARWDEEAVAQQAVAMFERPAD